MSLNDDNADKTSVVNIKKSRLQEPELVETNFPTEVYRQKLMEVEDVGLAVYKKNIVVVKRINKKQILLTRNVRKELKIVRRFTLLINS